MPAKQPVAGPVHAVGMGKRRLQRHSGAPHDTRADSRSAGFPDTGKEENHGSSTG